MQHQTPEGYVHYDPTDPNHVRHVRKIHLHHTPYNTPQLPHYVHFVHDMSSHQHYVYGLMNDEEPPATPYGWPLEAKLFRDPIPHLDASVDNSTLGIFNACYTKSLEVDASLYAVHDYGSLMDIDKYRTYMLDYEDLLTRQAQIEQDLHKWHTSITPIRQFLESSQIHHCVHPTYKVYSPFPNPPV